MKKIIVTLMVVMALVNLMAVLSPEIGFDALWYQLTLPRLWLMKGEWYFEGGLLYYSAMPRLGGVLFTPAMMIWGENGAKLVQFAAGIGTAALIYKISRIKFGPREAMFAAGGFYITNIVSWQSGSGYIDLIRTFFELFAFYLCVSDPVRDWLSWRKVTAGVMIGLAVGTKWQALATMLLLAAWFSPVTLPVGLVVASPWMIVAYRFTQNPLFPIFETFMSQIQIKEVGANFFGLKEILTRLLSVPWQFVRPFDDHSNPALLLVSIYCVLWGFFRRDRYERSVWIFAMAGLVLWQLTPPPSTRYYLPYLPYLALIIPYMIRGKRMMECIMVLSFVMVIGVRTWSSAKYVPYLTGRQTKEEFLYAHRERLPGTFVDEGGKIRKLLPSDARYLVDGMNNLYYFPFDFDHTSWAKDLGSYDYLVTNKAPIGEYRELVMENNLGIKVYKKALE